MTSATVSPPSATGDFADARARAVLITCLACGLTTLLDTAIVNVSLPALRHTLGASAAESQWILASYSLTFGLALVPSGRLGDLLGRRRLVIFGLMLFGGMALLTGFAVAPWMVIVARLGQGAGGGTISAQVLGLVQDAFTDGRRARALGYYTVVSSVAGMLGPILAGTAIAVAGDQRGWRIGALLTCPLAFATATYASRRLPTDRRRVDGASRPAVDIVGLGVLALATVLTVVAFVWPDLETGDSAKALVGAGAALGAFAWWERRRDARGQAALIPATLRRVRGFTRGTAAAMCWFGASLAQSTLITLYLIESLGIAPLGAALISLAGPAGMALTAWRSWRFLARFGRRGLTAALLAQAAVLVVVVVTARFVDGVALLVVLIPFQFVAGLANGCFEAPNRTLTLADVPPASGGVAAGVLQLAQRMAATVCIAVATAGVFDQTDVATSEAFRRGLTVCAGLLVVAALLVPPTVEAARSGRRGRGGAEASSWDDPVQSAAAAGGSIEEVRDDRRRRPARRLGRQRRPLAG